MLKRHYLIMIYSNHNIIVNNMEMIISISILIQIVRLLEEIVGKEKVLLWRY